MAVTGVPVGEEWGTLSYSMVFSNRLPVLVAASFLTLPLLFAGCLFDSGGGGPDPYALEEGHYNLGGRFDQSYAYDQYLIVLGGNRFEWVEYGYNAASSAVCRVTRKSGEYTLADSTVKLSITAEAEPFTKCGMTKADFQGLILEAKAPPTGANYPIRNRIPGSFESKGLFGRAGDWRVYANEKDPYGFYR